MSSGTCSFCSSHNVEILDVKDTHLQTVYEKLIGYRVQNAELHLCYICQTRLLQCQNLFQASVHPQNPQDGSDVVERKSAMQQSKIHNENIIVPSNDATVKQESGIEHYIVISPLPVESIYVKSEIMDEFDITNRPLEECDFENNSNEDDDTKTIIPNKQNKLVENENCKVYNLSSPKPIKENDCSSTKKKRSYKKKSLNKQAKQMKSGCSDTCRLRCNQKINEKLRSDLYKIYLGMDSRKRQCQFIGKYVVQNRKKTNRNSETRRLNTIYYNLPLTDPSGNVKLQKVCQTMFINTFNIKKDFVYEALKNRDSDATEYLKEERQIKSACNDSCRFNCSKNIDETTRSDLYNVFWSMDSEHKQWHIVRKYVQKKKKVMSPDEASSRLHTLYYILPSNVCGNTKLQRVCQTMFLNTFNISKDFVYAALDKSQKSDMENEFVGIQNDHSEEKNPLQCLAVPSEVGRKIGDTDSAENGKLNLENRTDSELQRLGNDNNWSHLKRKLFRDLGMSYMSAKGDMMEARKLRDSCKSCRLRCAQKFDEKTRRDLFNNFWGTGCHVKRWKIIREYVVQKYTKTVSQSRRLVILQYNLPLYDSNNVKLEKVCRNMFLNTFGISKMFVYKALNKSLESSDSEDDDT